MKKALLLGVLLGLVSMMAQTSFACDGKKKEEHPPKDEMTLGMCGDNNKDEHPPKDGDDHDGHYIININNI